MAFCCCGGACGGAEGLFAPRGEVPDTTPEKGQSTKYKSGFVCVHLWPQNPSDKFRKKKKKKNPERFCAGKRGAHTTNPDLDLYLYF